MINDKYMELLPLDYKISYDMFMRGKNLTAFSSHQPLIIHLLNTITEGEVLEFGMGWNSSPIMNLICGMQGRQLTSLDTDVAWASKFTSYQKPIHDVVCMQLFELVEWDHPLFKKHYSIAFVDGAPAEIRQPFLEKIKDNADYIVVHDTECVVQGVKNCYAFDFSMFKHVYHFKSKPPMTSLVSNLDKVNEEVLKIFNPKWIAK